MFLRPKTSVFPESLGQILSYSPLWYFGCPRIILSWVSPVDLEPAGTFVEHLYKDFLKG